MTTLKKLKAALSRELKKKGLHGHATKAVGKARTRISSQGVPLKYEEAEQTLLKEIRRNLEDGDLNCANAVRERMAELEPSFKPHAASGKMWLKRFLERHGLKAIKGGGIEKCDRQSPGELREIIQSFWRDLHDDIRKLREKGEVVLVNGDETSMKWEFGSQSYIDSKDNPLRMYRPLGRSDGRTHSTLLTWISSDIRCKLKPMTVLPRNGVTNAERAAVAELTEKYGVHLIPRGNAGGSGYMDTKLFECAIRRLISEKRDMEKKFEKRLILIVLVDSVRLHERAIEATKSEAEQADVFLTLLPPNTTAYIQPCDTSGVFRSIKNMARNGPSSKPLMDDRYWIGLSEIQERYCNQQTFAMNGLCPSSSHRDDLYTKLRAFMDAGDVSSASSRDGRGL